MGIHMDPWEPTDDRPYDCGYQPSIVPVIVALVVVVALALAFIIGAVA
jgi:hypothetical protein